MPWELSEETTITITSYDGDDAVGRTIFAPMSDAPLTLEELIKDVADPSSGLLKVLQDGHKAALKLTLSVMVVESNLAAVYPAGFLTGLFLDSEVNNRGVFIFQGAKLPDAFGPAETKRLSIPGFGSTKPFAHSGGATPSYANVIEGNLGLINLESPDVLALKNAVMNDLGGGIQVCDSVFRDIVDLQTDPTAGGTAPYVHHVADKRKTHGVRRG